MYVLIYFNQCILLVKVQNIFISCSLHNVRKPITSVIYMHNDIHYSVRSALALTFFVIFYRISRRELGYAPETTRLSAFQCKYALNPSHFKSDFTKLEHYH